MKIITDNTSVTSSHRFISIMCVVGASKALSEMNQTTDVPTWRKAQTYQRKA